MEHRAVLGEVDALAAEHALDPGGQLRRLGQLGEQLQGGGIHPVLGVVEEQAGGFEGEALEALASYNFV